MAPHAINGISGHDTHDSNIPYRPTAFDIQDHTIEYTRPLKVVVIGAGLSGVLAGILLPAKCPGIELIIIEKNAEVGGTWFENTYPGVRCDIPSHVYQATFAPNTQWTEEFATGTEILKYWKDLARRYNVHDLCRFQQKVKHLEWSDESAKWTLEIDDLKHGSYYTDTADVVLTAIGRFNEWRLPKYPGMEDFRERIVHTSDWDSNVEVDGEDIAIIGNGASGIQILPAMQPKAHRIDHYCRSRTWITRSWAGDVRTAGGQPFAREQLEAWKDPAKYLAFRKPYEDKYYRGFHKAFRGSDGNESTREDAIQIMSERLKAAGKPGLIDRMIPDFSPLCRRPTPGPGYLEAICQENVNYIDTPIERFTETGILTTDGVHREVSAVFCATGANTDLVPPFPIRSRGIDLSHAWKPGNDPGFPDTYFGIASPGFPNLFWLYGPQAGGVAGTVPHVVENQIATVAKLLRKIGGQGIRSMEPSRKATDEFAEFSERFYKDTVLTDQCSSWYNGGIKGNRIHGLWPGSAAHLTIARRDPRWEDWKYTYFSTNRFAYLGNGGTAKERDPKSDMTDYLKLPEELDLRTLHE